MQLKRKKKKTLVNKFHEWNWAHLHKTHRTASLGRQKFIRSQIFYELKYVSFICLAGLKSFRIVYEHCTSWPVETIFCRYFFSENPSSSNPWSSNSGHPTSTYPSSMLPGNFSYSQSSSHNNLHHSHEMVSFLTKYSSCSGFLVNHLED